MLKTMAKYAVPLCITLLLSSIFRNPWLVAGSLLISVGLTHFEFFETRKEQAESTASKLFALALCGLFLGGLIGLIFEPTNVIFNAMFNTCFAAFWGSMLHRMMIRMWRSG